MFALHPGRQALPQFLSKFTGLLVARAAVGRYHDTADITQVNGFDSRDRSFSPVTPFGSFQHRSHFLRQRNQWF